MRKYIDRVGNLGIGLFLGMNVIHYFIHPLEGKAYLIGVAATMLMFLPYCVKEVTTGKRQRG